jgi:hypothetical protein
MSLTKTVSLFAGTTLALTGVAFGSTEANNPQGDALTQIAELKAEIASLKAQSGENWLTEKRAADIKGLVQDVLADADTRASLQGGTANAGYDNGFFVASSDGNFRLNINGGSSIRWTFNSRSFDNAPAAGATDENNWGFSSRHTSIALSGHIVDPSWKFKINFNFFDASGDYNGSSLGEAFLNDWWVMKDFGGWYLKAGQFVSPFSRERLMDDYGLQTLDHTNSSYTFGLGRTQGVEFGMTSDWLRLAAAFSDGIGRFSPTQNSGFNPSAASPSSDFAISGRVEGKLAGTWAQFEDDQSWRGEEFGLLLGVGGYFQSGGQGNANFAGVGEDGEEYGFTADVTASFGGFSVTGAAFYTFADDEFAAGAGTGGDDFENYGAFAQVGFFLTDEFELVGRYEYGDLGGLGGVVDNNLQSVATIGANWYFAKNRAKWQTEVSYGFVSMDASAFAVGGNGWYTDGTDNNGDGEDGQWVIRTGLTVSF